MAAKTDEALSKPENCYDCGMAPGEQHEYGCDWARCVTTGGQWIQCEGELHEYNGREYSEHEGPCAPTTHTGYFPGVLECREYGLYTSSDSFCGKTEDLNTLYAYGKWDSDAQRRYLTPDVLSYIKN